MPLSIRWGSWARSVLPAGSFEAEFLASSIIESRFVPGVFPGRLALIVPDFADIGLLPFSVVENP